MLLDVALLCVGTVLIAGALSRKTPSRGATPSFWDRSPDGALINAVLGFVLGAAAIAYAIAAFVR